MYTVRGYPVTVVQQFCNNFRINCYYYFFFLIFFTVSDNFVGVIWMVLILMFW